MATRTTTTASHPGTSLSPPLRAPSEGEVLASICQGVAALARCESLADVKVIRDRSELVRKYAKDAKAGLDLQNEAAELKLRAERRAGEILSSMKLRGGDRRSAKRELRSLLKAAGITQNQSSRWQQLARIPDDVFLAFVESARSREREITTAGLLRSITQHERRSAKVIEIVDSTDDDFEGLDGQDNSPQGILTELSDHVGALNKALAAYFEGDELAAIHPCERRYVRRLIFEIATLLTALRRQLPAMPGSGE